MKLGPGLAPDDSVLIFTEVCVISDSQYSISLVKHASRELKLHIELGEAVNAIL